MKEKKTTATPNKSSWTILLSAFGTRERRYFIQSQLPLRLKGVCVCVGCVCVGVCGGCVCVCDGGVCEKILWSDRGFEWSRGCAWVDQGFLIFAQKMSPSYIQHKHLRSAYYSENNHARFPLTARFHLP